MSLIYRMMGKLTSFRQSGVASLIEACDKMEAAKFVDSSDCTFAVSELIQYQRTNDIVHKIITAHFKNTKQNLKLDESSYHNVCQFLKQGLISRDMKAVDSAVSLLWNNFPKYKFPLMQILRTLTMTKPLGSQENQQLWCKVVADLAFYAIPDKFSPSEAKRFLKLHGSYPQNFINLLKYSHFFSQHTIEALSTTQMMIEKIDSIEDHGDSDINQAYSNIESGIDVEYDSIKAELETRFDEADWDGTVTNLKEIIGQNLLKRINKFTEKNKSQSKKRVNHQSLFEMQYNPKINSDHNLDTLAELLELRSSIVDKEADMREKTKLESYSCDDLLDECFKNSEPRLEDFEKVEKWLEGVVAENKRFLLSEEALDSIIKASIRLNRENFSCFFFKNFGLFSDHLAHPLLGVEMIRIIAESEVEGDRISAIFNVLTMCNPYFEDDFEEDDQDLGPLDWPTVPELILKAYLNSGDITKAYTFFRQMCLLDHKFEFGLQEDMFEFFNKLNNLEVLQDFVDYEEDESKKDEILELIEKKKIQIEKGEIKADNRPYDYYCDIDSGDIFINYYTSEFEVDKEDLEEVMKRNPDMDIEENADNIISLLTQLQQDKSYITEKKIRVKDDSDLDDSDLDDDSLMEKDDSVNDDDDKEPGDEKQPKKNKISHKQEKNEEADETEV